jgi:addiction module RelE/StbE family toxin
MIRRVVWSDSVRTDIRSIIAFVSERNPDAADRLIDEIDIAGSKLGEHDTGRPGRIPGTREKSVPRIGYILSYRIERGGEQITILRVVHSRQDWRVDEWPKA